VPAKGLLHDAADGILSCRRIGASSKNGHRPDRPLVFCFSILWLGGSGHKNACKTGMNLSSINNYFTNHTASVLSSGLSTNSPSKNANGVSGASSDSGQLSPFAQLLSTLQQLEQSNPTQYQQVTQQIATKLQTAAATDTKNGNSAQAAQLTTLSKDFTTASQSGQLPNAQDLASAIGGAGHHHFYGHASSGDSANSSSTGSASSLGTNATLQQLLASFGSGNNQASSTNPMSIIMSTLSSAGVNG